MAKNNSLALSRAKKRAEKALKKNQLGEARAALEQVCELAPQDVTAWLSLANFAEKQTDFAMAEKAFRQALLLGGEVKDAYKRLAGLLVMRDQMDEAEGLYRTHLKNQPNDIACYHLLGVVLEGLDNMAVAESTYREALQLNSDNAQVLSGLGRVLRHQGQYEEAKGHLERAIEINPKLGAPYLEIANLLRQEGRFEEALQNYDYFFRYSPQEKVIYLLSKASLCVELEQYADAVKLFDQVMTINPRSIQGHCSRAQALLTLGKFREGWDEYEWRRADAFWLKQPHMSGYNRMRPNWTGEPLDGKNILVYAEQGFGDIIHFSRYLPALAARGANVHFHCQAVVKKLFDNMPGLASVTVRDAEAVTQADYDYFLPLMSLPRLFKHYDIGAFPNDAPYLSPDESKVAGWHQRMDVPELKVGLVWSGAGTNPIDLRRSVSLDQFDGLKDIPHVKFFSLQKGDAVSQIDRLPHGLDIVDVSDELNDFSDTAAVIANLDLVITVDTAVAHLAGALNCPVWVMIYSGPDWRWLLEREDSPWYPSMRLFRQAPRDDWQAVINHIQESLSAWVAEKHSA
ncbi:tetratricopeptide repeat protein [Pseudomonadota bacterium]